MTTIIGHEKQQAYLRRLATSSRVPQSWVFSGPSEIGKFAVAREWAGELITGQTESADRSEVEADRLVVAPESVTVKGVTRERDIPVEEVREALKQAILSPSIGRFRVLIIRDAHRLTEKSQNALLKTLEEPPNHLILILVTHRIGRLLSTILSRCQVLDFHPVEKSLLQTIEVKKTPVPEFLRQAGRPGLLWQFADAPAKFQRDMAALEQLVRLERLTVSERLQLSEALSKDVRRAARLLEWWLTLRQAEARAAVGAYELWRGVTLIDEAQRQLEGQPKNARLLLDTLFLNESFR